MIDMNNAEVQRELSGKPFPPDSVVALQIELMQPPPERQGQNHAMAWRKDGSNNEFIFIKTIPVNDVYKDFATPFVLWGSETAAKISMRTLRAIVESARNISPSDASPTATAGRQLSDWLDFNGMTFLAKVGTVVEKSQKDGQWYVNNTIKRIITPDDAEYSAGEWISDKPLPTVPEAGIPATAAIPAASSAPAAWGGSTAVNTTATQPAPTSAAAPPMPAWAGR